MNEMVERVAHAINLAGTRWLNEENSGSVSWFDVPGEVLAYAAILAMREPTQVMIDLGWAIGTGDNPKTVWETMIDAALDS